QLIRAGAQFVKQTRVLDGDDRLRREVLHQLYLLVGEWPHFLAEHTYRADKLALFEHRHAHICPRPCNFDEGDNADISPDVGLISTKVGDVDDLFGLGNAIKRDSGIIAQVKHRIAPPRIDVALLTVDRYRTKDRPLAQEQIAERCLADARGI